MTGVDPVMRRYVLELVFADDHLEAVAEILVANGTCADQTGWRRGTDVVVL